MAGGSRNQRIRARRDRRLVDLTNSLVVALSSRSRPTSFDGGPRAPPAWMRKRIPTGATITADARTAFLHLSLFGRLCLDHHPADPRGPRPSRAAVTPTGARRGHHPP